MRPLFTHACAFILFIVALLSSVAAQRPSTVEEWSFRLTRFGESIPQEKVYVHLDNTCYFLGDTIWYAAYTRRTDKGVPSNVSRVLYVELFNQDGYLVERQLVEMQGGRGHGNFVLPDTLYGGYYELRAYTRWQLNWGQTQHPHTKYAEQWFFNRAIAREFYRDYDKLYSRVFPVYDRPKQPGEFYHDMTTRPLRRIYKEEDLSGLRLSLFPEGGTLVAGASGRVAFEAATEEGQWVDGLLVLTDAAGRVVAEGETRSRGRGLVAFMPQAGEKYTATFTAQDGRTAKAVAGHIPADGVALQVERQGGEWTIGVQRRGLAADKRLGVTVMHEGVVRWSAVLDGDSLSVVPADSLPAGVCQATVFDADGRVWADRLFFVTPPQAAASLLAVEGLKTEYAPFEKVDFRVRCSGVWPEGSAPASLSLAVRDAARQDYLYDSGDILTEMLLASEIKGFVPQPRYFFESDDEEHRTALDLLMLTQGWRRFDWHTMATPGAFALQHPAETQTQVITGVVHNYTAQAKADELRDVDVAAHQAFMEADDGYLQSRWDAEEQAAASEPGAMDNEGFFQQIVDQGKQDILRTGYSRMNGSVASSRFFADEGRLKREVRVHAEFVQPGSKESVVGDVDTQQGRFKMQLPRFYDQCLLYLAASDTTKWKHGKEPLWVSMDEEDYPEFYVRLCFPYPRFVHPYAFYQTTLAPTPPGRVQEADFADDDATLMSAVTVKARRRGLRAFDASKPAFVLDAYQAFNEVSDAGLSVAWFQGRKHFASSVARTYIGDMNMERAYEVKNRLDTHDATFYRSSSHLNAFNKLMNLDKVYVYTDYSPRREGSRQFEQSNQPSVTIDLRRLENEGQRVTYRDRRYVLQGFAVADDFYHPDYSSRPLPEGCQDYRRTLYWNPDLQLDEHGQAAVSFYTGSRSTTLAVDAQGQAPDGTLLTN